MLCLSLLRSSVTCAEDIRSIRLDKKRNRSEAAEWRIIGKSIPEIRHAIHKKRLEGLKIELFEAFFG